MFQRGLEYNTVSSYRSLISAFHEVIGSFIVGKHPHVTNLMTGIFSYRFPQPRYTFIWDVETVMNFLETLNSNKIELQLLKYTLTILLALTGFARAYEMCYLSIRYLIRNSSAKTIHLSKVKKTARKNKIRLPITYLNFPSSKNFCAGHHIDLYSQRIQNIRNG